MGPFSVASVSEAGLVAERYAGVPKTGCADWFERAQWVRSTKPPPTFD